MRIVRLQAEGFKRLVAVDITPDGDLIEVRGNNGEGKSSLLDAIFATLAGKDAAPIKPVRTGEEYALITLDLGELKVTRYFGDDGATKLKVENAEGAVFTQGQTMLDALVGSISFDPLEFASLPPKDQAAELRRLVPLDVDLDALAKADTADREVRRDLNRDGKALKARIEAIAVPADLPDEAPDRGAVADEMAKAGEVNAAIERERGKREAEKRTIERVQGEANALKRQVAELRERANAAEKESARIAKDASDRATALIALPPVDSPVDVSALRQRLDDAERVSALVARRDERKRLTAEFDGLAAKSAALTKAMADRTDKRAAALKSAKMPVDGLSFAEMDGDLIVTLNGEPFEQASSADKLKTSVAIAMAANPKLRVLRIKDGSLLDKRNLEVLRQTATAHDFQIWSEFVGDEGAGIIMEAGKVKGAAEPERVEPPKRRKKGDPSAADPADAGNDGPAPTTPVAVTGHDPDAIANQPKRKPAAALREFNTPKPEGSLL